MKSRFVAMMGRVGLPRPEGHPLHEEGGGSALDIPDKPGSR
jgi:hypothetical protein